MLRRLFQIFTYVFVTIVIITIFFIFLSLQTNTPLKSNQAIDANVAKHSQLLLQRIKNSYKTNKMPSHLTINNNELIALSAIVNRAHPDVLVVTQIHQQTLQNKLSWKLPFSFIDLYLNTQINILSSKQGLKLGNIKIGNINLSGKYLLYFIKTIANLFQPELGTQTLQSIKSLVITKHSMKISYQLPDGFQLNGLQRKGRLIALRDELAFFGNVEKIRFYYQGLLRFINTASPPQELFPYLRKMISLAQQQVITSDETNAKKENQAALLALAIYFGSSKFELMVGDISRLSLKEQRQRKYLINHVKVSGRNDLQQHFIYSMALQLFSTVDVSYTVGELKELLDSNIGGSGFSFADLMADRAGVRFAMLATQSTISAQSIQAKITQNDLKNLNLERGMFVLLPSISELPEGLTQVEFQKKYRDVNSLAYQKIVALIDQRLKSLIIYQIN